MGTDNYSINIGWTKLTENLDGDAIWVNPNNGNVIDGVVATCHLKATWKTDSVFVTTPTIAVPTPSYPFICSGFTATIKCDASNIGTTNVDLIVQMCVNGAPIGNVYTLPITSGTLTNYTFAAEDDLWGQTIYTQVGSVDKNFGFIWHFQNGAGGLTDIDLDGISSLQWYYRRHTTASCGGGFG